MPWMVDGAPFVYAHRQHPVPVVDEKDEDGEEDEGGAQLDAESYLLRISMFFWVKAKALLTIRLVISVD